MTEQKLVVVLSFLQNSDTKEILYNLVSCLRRILLIKLDIENGIIPLNTFDQNEEKTYLDMAKSYLVEERQNEGDEESLMVRYVRNYFESLHENVIHVNNDDDLPLCKPPRFERSMNIYSPFNPLYIQ